MKIFDDNICRIDAITTALERVAPPCLAFVVVTQHCAFAQERRYGMQNACQCIGDAVLPCRALYARSVGHRILKQLRYGGEEMVAICVILLAALRRTANVAGKRGAGERAALSALCQERSRCYDRAKTRGRGVPRGSRCGAVEAYRRRRRAASTPAYGRHAASDACRHCCPPRVTA